MARIPFGVSRLDALVGNGAPPGSVVLLAGEAGAGARELQHTCAVMNGVAEVDPDLFDLYYGDLHGEAEHPDEIHYVSFTDDEDALRREIGYTMDEELVAAGLETVQFADLSPEYFQLSPVPREWYLGRSSDIEQLSADTERRGVIDALAAYLDEHAAESLVVIDSLTDLVDVHTQGELDWHDVVYLVQGIRKAAETWDALVLVHVSHETLSDTEFAKLMSGVDGTMLFEWESGGNEISRTMVVREFRGVLSQLEAEDIVRFETEIRESGFDISDVRKIR
ncbi:MAG: RAD55 family ATPase [Halobacteriaceae archaeon]